MSDDVSIRFRNVTKQYYVDRPTDAGFKNLVLHLPSQIRAWRTRQPFHALSNVTFEVQCGTCLSLIGANGAGKSTALGLIAGVLRPTSGSVVARGRICPLLELGAGFHLELSGRENIVLNGILLGLTRREVLERSEEIIDFSELRGFIDAPLRTYSSGMMARLGFSVAVHLEPDILLVDEILAVGDEAFQHKCLRRIQQFRDRDMTLVFVSHNLAKVEQISDRVAWIERGQLMALGDPSAVIAAYQRRTMAA